MKPPSLKKLLFRKGLPESVAKTLDALAPGSCLLDMDRSVLWGELICQSMEHPVLLEEEAIGWVAGGVEAKRSADLLSYLAELEREKRAVCQDALEKYKELSLVYALTEKMQASLDSREIASIMLDELRRFFKVTHASLMLFDERCGELKEVAIRGREYSAARTYKPGQGIPGHVFESGRAEVVDNVINDPRSRNEAYIPGSQICAPLKIKEKSIGVVNITSPQRGRFTAAELKFLSTLAVQAALSLENAMIYEDLADNCTDAISDEDAPRADKDPGLSVLYVEDSRNSRMLVDFYLRKTPYELSFAQNGEEGLLRFQEGEVDVVLMDMEMPVLNGYEATRAIRDYEREHGLPPTPVIALTGHDGDGAAHRCRDVGCTGVLNKPVEKQELFACLKDLARRVHGAPEEN
ncbi:MAG: response regulator [Desulfovibrionaceae bacterium]